MPPFRTATFLPFLLAVNLGPCTDDPSGRSHGFPGPRGIASSIPTPKDAESVRERNPLESDPQKRGPSFGTGVWRVPKAFPRQLCSHRHPLCVYGTEADEAKAMVTLGVAEEAWDALAFGLGFALPSPSQESGVYEMVLDPDEANPSGTFFGGRDPRSGFDRGWATTVLHPQRADGCPWSLLVATHGARAALWHRAPAADEASARATAAYLGRLIVPCAMGLPHGVPWAQGHPSRSLLEGPPSELSSLRTGDLSLPLLDGSELFPWWLDSSFGASPGVVPRALWALASSRTPADARHFSNDPDSWDILRESLRNALFQGSRLEDALVRYFADRAFVGIDDDGPFLRETRSLSGVGSIPWDWSPSFGQLPRAFAGVVGVAPLGATYLRLSDIPPQARLRIEIEWEEHASMQWVAVKVGPTGKRRQQIVLPNLRGATNVRRTLSDFTETPTLVLVGVHLGDPNLTFDPDDEGWESHGYLAKLAAEESAEPPVPPPPNP